MDILPQLWILHARERYLDIKVNGIIIFFYTPNDVLVLLLSFMETNSIKKMETKKYIHMTIAFMDA